MWFILDRYLSLMGLSPAILRICNVLYYPTSVFFVTNKANCFVCSSQQSWRAAGCCFLDNDLYVLSCEHTFPISCYRFSSLGKLNSCSYTVFPKSFFPRCSLLSSFKFLLITFPVPKRRRWLSSRASSTEQDGVTPEHWRYCSPARGWLCLK